MDVYKVMEQRLSLGCRIEGFTCNCYVFTSYEEAMDFAYNLANEYYQSEGKLPNDQRDDSDSESDDDDGETKLERAEEYEWGSDYDSDYFVMVEKDRLELGYKGIVMKIKFDGGC